MAQSSSGGIRLLYGVVLRDKSKTASTETLRAYKTVAEDMLKDLSGADAQDLRDALKDVDQAITAKK